MGRRCESVVDGVDGYRVRLLNAWMNLGMRMASIGTLVGRLGKIRRGTLSSLERDDIRRTVRRQCLPVVTELDDEVVEADGQTEDCVGEDAMYDFVVENVVDDIVVEDVVRESVVVDRVCDLWVDGDVVMPVDQEQKMIVSRLREVITMKKFIQVPSLKSRNRSEVMAQVKVVNGVVGNLVRHDQSISDVNRLMYACSVVVAERLGLLKERKEIRQDRNDPWWKRRIEGSIVQWRKDLSKIEELRRGRWKPSDSERKRLDKLYGLTENGAKDVSAFLKSKIHSGSIKVQRYLDRKIQFHQNNLFKNNQSYLYKELSGQAADGRNNQTPDAQEAIRFWIGIWSEPGSHDVEAEWLGRVKQKLSRVPKQGSVVVDVAKVKAGVGRLSNWKPPGPDGVMGFWFKKLTALHQAIAVGLEDCLQKGKVPEWMVKGRTVLIQKDSAKGTVASNYRPITCLSLMWKLFTGIFAEDIYDHLKDNNLLPDEQKGCRKRSRERRISCWWTRPLY